MVIFHSYVSLPEGITIVVRSWAVQNLGIPDACEIDNVEPID